MCILKIVHPSCVCVCLCVCVCSAMSDSLQPCGLQSTRLIHPWDPPGKNTGVGCHFLLQRVFLTQGLNLCLLHLLHQQADTLPLSHLGSSQNRKVIPMQLFILRSKTDQGLDSDRRRKIEQIMWSHRRRKNIYSYSLIYFQDQGSASLLILASPF